MALRELSLIVGTSASMKVPPKRKGNKTHSSPWQSRRHRLNESPSEKEGKFIHLSPNHSSTQTPQ